MSTHESESEHTACNFNFNSCNETEGFLKRSQAVTYTVKW